MTTTRFARPHELSAHISRENGLNAQVGPYTSALTHLDDAAFLLKGIFCRRSYLFLMEAPLYRPTPQGRYGLSQQLTTLFSVAT